MKRSTPVEDILKPLGKSLKEKIDGYELKLLELRQKELDCKPTEKTMSKVTANPQEFGAALAKALKDYIKKGEGGAIETGEVSAEGAASGIPGSGEKPLDAVAKDEISAGEASGEGAGKGIPGSGDPALGAVKKDEMGAIEAGEVSADGAAKGIPGSGEEAVDAVAKGEMDPAAGWKPCLGCGRKMNPVEALLSAGGKCGRCAKALVKQELMIDTNHEADHDKRVKEIGRVEGRSLPGDKKPKKVEAEGSGGEIKKDEMSIPKAPKPPQAPGAAPTLHKGALSGMAAAPKDMQAHAGQAAFSAGIAGAAAPEAAPKAMPKPPDQYDASAFTPAPNAAPSGLEIAVSPVKHHLAKLGGGLGKAEMKDTCSKCGSKMEKAHSC